MLETSHKNNISIKRLLLDQPIVEKPFDPIAYFKTIDPLTIRTLQWSYSRGEYLQEKGWKDFNRLMLSTHILSPEWNGGLADTDLIKGIQEQCIRATYFDDEDFLVEDVPHLAMARKFTSLTVPQINEAFFNRTLHWIPNIYNVMISLDSRIQTLLSTFMLYPEKQSEVRRELSTKFNQYKTNSLSFLNKFQKVPSSRSNIAVTKALLIQKLIRPDVPQTKIFDPKSIKAEIDEMFNKSHLVGLSGLSFIHLYQAKKVNFTKKGIEVETSDEDFKSENKTPLPERRAF